LKSDTPSSRGDKEDDSSRRIITLKKISLKINRNLLTPEDVKKVVRKKKSAERSQKYSNVHRESTPNSSEKRSAINLSDSNRYNKKGTIEEIITKALIDPEMDIEDSISEDSSPRRRQMLRSKENLIDSVKFHKMPTIDVSPLNLPPRTASLPNRELASIKEEKKQNKKESKPQKNYLKHQKSDTVSLQISPIQENSEEKAESSSQSASSSSKPKETTEAEENEESELSQSEVEDLVEHDIISKSTMKRLTLIRKPTDEGLNFQSPTKLKNPVNQGDIEDKIKESLMKEQSVHDREIIDRVSENNEKYVNLKMLEVDVKMNAINRKLQDSQKCKYSYNL
jgi:hypothetical protein